MEFTKESIELMVAQLKSKGYTHQRVCNNIHSFDLYTKGSREIEIYKLNNGSYRYFVVN